MELTTAGAFITMFFPIAVFLGLQWFFIRGLTKRSKGWGRYAGRPGSLAARVFG